MMMQTRLLRRTVLPTVRYPLARTLATTAPGHVRLLQAITDDHREIEAFYDQYLQNGGNTDAQQRWANQLTWEIARHSISEELVVYPLLEKVMADQGHVLAESDRDDHQFVKDRLKKLESIEVGTTAYNAILKDIMDHLEEHMRKEETEQFPQLEAKLGEDQSISTARSFERTKAFVPTRSHPNAPNKPPYETLAGLMAAPMDKLM
ncbi:hemerythrin domain-containing protein, partial [Pectobacterium atrosepticum]|nr:hemerythrin domain-containing protein [Pectobacterium atrosepticum]